MITLDEFVKKIAEEFDETPSDLFSPDTKFKDLDQWGSLIALSIISLVDEEFDKQIKGKDLREAETIEDLYNTVAGK